MHIRKLFLHEIVPAAIGLGICVAAMMGVFLLAGRLDVTVLRGGLAGWLISLTNYFLLSLFAGMAADRAEKQDVSGGQQLIRLSYLLRMAGLILVLAVCAGSGAFHVLALTLPLLFLQPFLTIRELFNQKGRH